MVKHEESFDNFFKLGNNALLKINESYISENGQTNVVEESKVNLSKMMDEKVSDSQSMKDNEIAQLKSSREKDL